MSLHRRPIPIVLALAAATLASPAIAGSRHGGVGGPPGPEILPPNAAPGQCFSRRVTGPGGAYRWDRVECDSAYSGAGYGYGQWGYGGDLNVQTQGYGRQRGYAVDCGCDGHGYQAPCDPCAASPAGYARGRHDQGGYVQGGHAGDRYGERPDDARYARSQYEYAYERSAYGDGYAYGRGGQGVSYPPPYGYGYVAAGRDEAGYLIWPGKAP